MGRDKIQLTERQRRCAGTIDRSVAILAGAGSGKTAVLIERIKNIVTSGKVDLSEIVAITFTEKAAGELIYRITAEIPAELRAQIDLATITTIDGFCTKILREDAAAIGINPDFNILEEHASRIMNHRIISGSLKELLRAGDEDAQRVIDEMEYRYAVGCLEEMVEARGSSLVRAAFRGGQGKSRVPAANDRESLLNKSLHTCFTRILENLEEEKRRLGVLDFMDLEIKTLGLLQNHNEIRKKHQNRIKHLLVDEYQDTSDLQTEIVKQIYNPKKNILCIVGDPGQSIYRFRGANPEGLYATRQLIEKNGGETIELTENFRSARPILGFVNELFSLPVSASPKDEAIQVVAPFRVRTSRRLKPAATKLIHRSASRNDNENYFLPLEARAEAGPHDKVAKIEIDSADLKAEEIREKEAEALTGVINDLNSSGGASYGDIALLFRSFTDIQIYERALNRHRIPYYRSGGRTFLIQPEVADIILCLRVLQNPSDDTLAYGLARSTIIGLSDQECYKIAAGRERHIFRILSDDPRYGFLKYLQEVNDHLSVAELIREIAYRSNLYQVFDLILTSGQATANIEKLISIAETMGSQYDYTLEDFLAYIDDLKMRGVGMGEPPIFGRRDNAVKLLTVHAAKGLEFPVVILADLLRADRTYGLPYIIDKDAGIGFKLRKGDNPIAGKEKTAAFEEILRSDAEKDLSEKERLLYVAATRAKELLLIPTFEVKNSKSSWYEWLAPLTHDLEVLKTQPSGETTGIAAGRIEAAPPYIPSAPGELTMTVSQLESHYRCPQEYYLKYVMKLPAEKIVPKTDKMGANTIGNVVHKAIYLASKNGDTDWEKLIGPICREYGYPHPGPSDRTKIEKYLRAYSGNEYHDSHLTEPQHEIPFLFKKNGTVIKGTIDCIFKDGESFSIVDFKTDTVRNTDDIKKKVEEYQLQIMTYAIAAKRALRADIHKMALLFLDGGHSEEIELGDEHFHQGSKLIDEITNAIKSADFDIDNREPPCHKCPYHHNRTCWLAKT